MGTGAKGTQTRMTLWIHYGIPVLPTSGLNHGGGEGLII